MSTDPNQDTIRAAVLRDAGGNYYALPLDLIEQGRVPAEQVAAFEQMLNEQADVQGFSLRGSAPLPPPKLPPVGGGAPGVQTNVLWGDYFWVDVSKNALSKFTPFG